MLLVRRTRSHLTIKEWSVHSKVRPTTLYGANTPANFDELWRPHPLYDWDIHYTVKSPLKTFSLEVV